MVGPSRSTSPRSRPQLLPDSPKLTSLPSSFTRTSTSPTSPVTYTLILDTYGSLTNCTITDTASPSWYHAWYDLPCNNASPSPFHLSWGWDYPGDFTVLTVESFPASGPRLKAFFGYDIIRMRSCLARCIIPIRGIIRRSKLGEGGIEMGEMLAWGRDKR